MARVLLVWTAIISVCTARPTVSTTRLVNRDNTSSTNPAKVYAPVAIVLGVLFALLLILGLRRRRRSRLTNRPAATPVTAEAIIGAGSQPVSTRTPSTPASGTTPAPRPRRTRRTPSQISTKSLPAYNEEPGDEELVLVRRIMETQHEEGDEDFTRSTIDVPQSRHTRNNSSMDQSDPDDSHVNYGHGTQSSLELNTPLLQTSFNPSHDMPHHSENVNLTLTRSRSLAPPEDTPGRRSFDSSYTDNVPDIVEPSISPDVSPSPSVQDMNAERGQAPAYGEHVQHRLEEEAPTPGSSNTPSGSEIISPASSDRRNSRVLRPLRKLFGASSSSSSAGAATNETASSLHPPPSTSHRPSLDTPSQTSASSPPTQSRTHSRLGSFGAALTRPMSHNSNYSSSHHRANSSLSLHPVDNLTSPSMISLNSIGAPLSHTVTRTEFSFPKKGPTPEQLAFLSSRESLGRFGVPFGSAAREQAAQAQEDPPPFLEALSPSTEASGSNPSGPNPPEEQTSTRGPSSTWWNQLTQRAGPSDSPPRTTPPELPSIPTDVSLSSSSNNADPISLAQPTGKPSLSASHALDATHDITSPTASTPLTPHGELTSSSTSPPIPTPIPSSTTHNAPSLSRSNTLSSINSFNSFATARETAPAVETPVHGDDDISEYDDAQSQVGTDNSGPRTPTVSRPGTPSTLRTGSGSLSQVDVNIPRPSLTAKPQNGPQVVVVPATPVSPAGLH